MIIYLNVKIITYSGFINAEKTIKYSVFSFQNSICVLVHFHNELVLRPKKEAFRLFPFSKLDLGFNFLYPLVQSRFDFFHHSGYYRSVGGFKLFS